MHGWLRWCLRWTWCLLAGFGVGEVAGRGSAGRAGETAVSREGGGAEGEGVGVDGSVGEFSGGVGARAEGL